MKIIMSEEEFTEKIRQKEVLHSSIRELQKEITEYEVKIVEHQKSYQDLHRRFTDLEATLKSNVSCIQGLEAHVMNLEKGKKDLESFIKKHTLEPMHIQLLKRILDGFVCNLANGITEIRISNEDFQMLDRLVGSLLTVDIPF